MKDNIIIKCITSIIAWVFLLLGIYYAIYIPIWMLGSFGFVPFLIILGIELGILSTFDN